MDKRIFCFYHCEDLDGISSAYLLKYYFDTRDSGRCYFFPCKNYGEQWTIDSAVADVGLIYDDYPAEIYIIDFSFGNIDNFRTFLRSVHKKYHDKDIKIIWIDHHEHTFNRVVKYIIDQLEDSYLFQLDNSYNNIKFCTHFSSDIAACKLTWDYFFRKESIPYGIQLLSNYDIWDHSDPNVLPFQYGMRLINNSIDNPINKYGTFTGKEWNKIFNHQISFIEEVIKEGKIIVENETEKTQELFMKNSFEGVFHGYQSRFLNVPQFEAGLLKIPDDIDILIIFNIFKESVKVGLKSNNPDLDCAELASKYNGGGHKGAAGFEINIENLENFLKFS